MEMEIEVMVSKEVVGIEELIGCENDEGDYEDVNWVETTGSSKAAEKIGKVEKGMEIEIGKDTEDVPLLGVRI